jgi:hypothetical protein
MRFIFYKVSHVFFFTFSLSNISNIIDIKRKHFFKKKEGKKQNIKEFCLQLLNKAKKPPAQI